MATKGKKIHFKLFRIDAEYYTFISGALISIPLSLLFEVAENYREIFFWLALVLSLAASFSCFHLSITLKDVNELYKSNKAGIGDIPLAWNSAISEKKLPCIIYFVLTVISFVLAIICVFLTQIIDSTTICVNALV